MIVSTTWFLLLSAALFSIGVGGVLFRKNALIMFMSIELMLNAVNLTFIAVAHELGLIEGHVAVLFVMVVAATEVTVGLAIVYAVFRTRSSANVDELSEMKG